MCDHCVNHTTKGKSKACQQREDENNMWLLDSGALAHFTFNFNIFIEYHQYAKPCHSQTANGLAPVLGEGTILICTVQWKYCVIITNNLHANLYLSASIAGYFIKEQLHLCANC